MCHSATARRLYGAEKCLETLQPVLPSGQYSVYKKLIASSLEQGRMQHACVAQLGMCTASCCA
ncbi:hypothetical protein ACS15_3972 [Ralstonia insidiosa]|uniref:Uncharacterized protein n=1 Tax=Ralstonia insidiosa TaxID=190721 RepID=A0AAC9FUT3_9RALS|nr:hypothetical protein ACS15_3972 [Ralstonia insidiosa]